MSISGEAIGIPDNPPIMNMETNDIANNMGVVRRRLPFHSVPSQLKTLMALGSAIKIVERPNVVPNHGFMPEINMWCPQTMNPNPAIPEIEKIIGL